MISPLPLRRNTVAVTKPSTSRPQEAELAASGFPREHSIVDYPRALSENEIHRLSRCPDLILRYPGSKSRVRSSIVAQILERIGHVDIEYREPFYGNGTILPCLLSVFPSLRYAWINDVDPGISALWSSVISGPHELAELIRETSPSTDQFWKAKEILTADPVRREEMDRNQIAFLKILVHRTSYSGYGIMSGGPLGGSHQSGSCRVNSRWNPEALIRSLEEHHALFRSIDFRRGGCSRIDFEEVIADSKRTAIIYLDPPYYGVGEKLYQYSMSDQDHRRLARCLRATRHEWVLSYNDCAEIRALYSDWATMNYLPIPYSCGRRRVERELLISNPPRRAGDLNAISWN